MEITEADELAALLEARAPLTGVHVQDVDLAPVAQILFSRNDLRGLVVLGGPDDPHLAAHLVAAGALVFPHDRSVPVNAYRSRLYTADELYAGLDGPGSYAETLDARAYRWSRVAGIARDAYTTLLRAIHDDSITDALDELSTPGPWVGVMGGHDIARGSDGFLQTARLGLGLAAAGFTVVTGGGPGAMEAANLGAVALGDTALEQACERLAAVPSFETDIAAWARLAFAVRAEHTCPPARAHGRSVGIPTWFYGHEPPNVFAGAVAKYFSNALREDGLLARCTGGVVVQPGAAGTVQEIFQRATRLYYGIDEGPLAPLVLVGDLWRERLPAWPVLAALGAGRSMGEAIHLVDTPDEAVALLRDLARSR